MPTLSTCQKKNFFCCDVSGIFARNVHTSSYSNDVKIILRIWHFSQWAENGCLMDGVATLCGTQRSGKILLNGAKNGCLKGLVGNGHSFCGRWNLQMKRVCLAAIAKVSHRKLPHVLIALLHIALLAPAYCKQPCVLKCNVQGCVQYYRTLQVRFPDPHLLVRGESEQQTPHYPLLSSVYPRVCCA